MSLYGVRRAIRSETSLVTIEAPAGCGKTYEAASGAIDLAKELRPGQEILLLAHTHAAVQEFRRRIVGLRAKVRAITIDAFALELVAPFADALGLPTPFRVEGSEAVPFEALAPKLLELVERAPSIARAVAGHYPVILLDEHQDARLHQHRILLELEKTGFTRLRFFGDPMQGIFGFGGEDMVDWSDLKASSAAFEQLDSPRRWEETPRLGDWIMSARVALEAGDSLPVDDVPPEVDVRLIDELDDVPNPNSDRVVQGLIGPLNRLLNRVSGSVGVLAWTNSQALGLRRACKGRLVVQEGADLNTAYDSLERARGVEGQPMELALEVVRLLSETSTGCTANFRRRLDRRLKTDGIDTRNPGKLRPFLDTLSRLYDQPDLATWCAVVGGVARHPPQPIRIDLPESFRTLGRLRLTDSEDPRVLLDRMLRVRRAAAHVPHRCASTIHKAKGQEFDHVVLAHCGATAFPNEPSRRRLLYVALSRARKSLTVLAPGRKPSPLLGMRA